MANFLNNLISSAQGSSYSVPKANTTSPLKQLTQTKYPQSVAPVAPIKTTTTPTQFVANPARTPVNVISATNLNTQPVTKPQITPITTAQNNLKSSVNLYSASPTELTTPTPTPTTSVKSERDTTLSRIKELVGMQGSKATDTTKAQEEVQLAQKREALNKANTAQLRLDQAYEKEIEEIQKNSQGSLDIGVKQRLGDAERAYLDKKADIAIDRLASQGDVETALKIVEDKINAKYEPIDNEIKNLQTYLQIYGNDMTESEKLQVQSQIQEQQAQANFARNKELSAYEAKLKQSDPLYQAQLEKAQNETNGINIDGSRLLTSSGKPMNDTQATAYGYAQRLVEADNIISNLGSQFTGARSLIGQNLPNIAKSTERQQFEQAQRNFINAVLRKESGAVISPEEFENAKQQYFPKPGDSSEVVAQKASNRSTVIDNLYRSAGVSTKPQEIITRPEDLRSKYNY